MCDILRKKNGGAVMHTLGDLKQLFAFIIDIAKQLIDLLKSFGKKDEGTEETPEVPAE